MKKLVVLFAVLDVVIAAGLVIAGVKMGVHHPAWYGLIAVAVIPVVDVVFGVRRFGRMFIHCDENEVETED